MRGENLVILVGNVGKQPEQKFTPKGTAVTTFSLATNEYMKNNKDGHTEWHNIVAWRQLAEIVANFVDKGDQVFVKGKIRTRSWEKDGKKFYRTEIIADEVKVFSTKGKKKDDDYTNTDGYKKPEDNSELGDDDIPF